MAIQENGRSNHVDVSTIWAYKTLRPGEYVLHSARADYLSVAIQTHLQSALDSMNGHDHPSLVTAVKPLQTEDTQYKLGVTVTHISHNEAETYRQKVTITTDPDKPDRLIGIVADNDSQTEMGLVINSVLRDPQKSVELEFKSRLEPEITVNEVATGLSRGNLYIYVRGKPVFSTNGHGK